MIVHARSRGEFYFPKTRREKIMVGRGRSTIDSSHFAALESKLFDHALKNILLK